MDTDTDTAALVAPGEGTWSGASGTAYRAQAASGLRVDARPGDVPGLEAHGFVRADAPPDPDPAAAEQAPAVDEAGDTSGGFVTA